MESAAAASIIDASAAASPSRRTARPVAPGTPWIRAMPSFGPRVNSVSPWRRSASRAGRRVPSGPSTRPMPATGPNACASCVISPAEPAPAWGTAGTMPWLRKSASRWQSPPDTAASPDRNVSSRTAMIARTSGGAQPRRPARGPGQQQVALMRTLLLLGQPDRGQRAHPGVDAVHRLPVTERPPGPFAAPCTAASRSGPMLTGWPAAAARIRPKSAPPAWVIASAGIASGTGASFRRPAARPGARWPGRRRCRGWPARGARAGSSPRRVPGRAAAR